MQTLLRNAARSASGGLRNMKIAVEGCCHGQLDAIYDRIAELERLNGYKVDLLVICGDFQAMRTQADMRCMSSPAKHLKMGTFSKYYTKKKVAPVLTVIIGGNHEASNYMWELYHGGFLAPNMYYLGAAGVVQFNGIRIAGLSGIYKERDYKIGHYETIPYDRSSLRSVYHVRQYDVQRIMQLNPVDVCLSHDWPQYIERHGDYDDLMKRMPRFRHDAEAGTLGSPPLLQVMSKLRPSWWFSGHMHCKFEATVKHEGPGNPETKFLALDQCLPKRDYLEVIDVPVPLNDDRPRFTFDAEWLGIVRATHQYFSRTKSQHALPPDDVLRPLIKKNIRWVKENVGENQGIMDVQAFTPTSQGPVPAYELDSYKLPKPRSYRNPQTAAFCRMLDIPNKID